MNDDCKLFLLILLQIGMVYRRTAYLDVHHRRIGASHQQSKSNPRSRMRGMVRAVRWWQEAVKTAIWQRTCRRETNGAEKAVEGGWKGLENVSVAEIMISRKREGEESVGSWLWCREDDAAIDAVQNMARNNSGSLVVMKREGQHIAGIVTERDYLKKIIADGRSPIYTKVGEIMTHGDKLVTVTSDTNILKAMQLMTENRIRHVPVIDGRIVGVISIVDVVRAVVEQQNGELKRLNEYIKGEYY